MDSKLNPAQRVGRLFDQAAKRIGTSLREGIVGLWNFAGSRQVFNGIAILGLVVLVYIGQQAFLAQRYLGTIAEAQQVAGYATMRQMQAMGWTPLDKAKPAPVPPAPKTIDPALLEHPGATPSSAPHSAPPAAAAPGK